MGRGRKTGQDGAFRRLLDKKFKVHVADPNHPITRGLKDYDFVDETYDRVSVDPGVHALLTTDEPTSEKLIGWTKTYAKSKVCYFQSGHDLRHTPIRTIARS